MKTTGHGSADRPAPDLQKGRMKKKSWFTIQKIHPQVFALAEFCHWEKVVSYLVVGRDNAALFDTGMGFEDISKAVQGITNLPISVFLTHAHWDHIGGAHLFHSVHLYNDPFDMELLKKGFGSTDVKELQQTKYFVNGGRPKTFAVPGVSEMLLVTDGQHIKLGDMTIEVIHTPGHTPGSACYVVEPYHVLITGDTIYPGPLYGQLPESNVFNFSKSVQKISQHIDSHTLVLPGHNSMSCSSILVKNISDGFSSIAQGKNKGEVIDDALIYRFNSFSVITPRSSYLQTSPGLVVRKEK